MDGEREGKEKRRRAPKWHNGETISGKRGKRGGFKPEWEGGNAQGGE